MSLTYQPLTSRAESDRCVVLLHGYADAKVGAIAWAPMWHELGYHALAIDLRARAADQRAWQSTVAGELGGPGAR